jgi:hypothetical protein
VPPLTLFAKLTYRSAKAGVEQTHRTELARFVTEAFHTSHNVTVKVDPQQISAVFTGFNVFMSVSYLVPGSWHGDNN